MSNIKEKYEKAARNVLGKPYPAEFSDAAERVRRNLLIGCSIAFLLLVGKLVISEESSVFGLRFDNLDNQLIYIGLLIFIGYQLLHFIWHAWDAFSYWRVRLTGVRVVFQTTSFWGGGDINDNPSDPKQSSLSNWWLEQTNQLKPIPELLLQLENQVEVGKIESSNNGQDISQLQTTLSDLKNTLEKTEKVVSGERIPSSLAGFENWYATMVVSQGLRWAIFEVGIPIIAGIGAISWLFCVAT